MRLYFYDPANGAELTKHPLNGCSVTATGQSYQDAAGNFINPYNGYSICVRGEFEVRGRKVTIADFPGFVNVLVKHWHPNHEFTEWSVLA